MNNLNFLKFKRLSNDNYLIQVSYTLGNFYYIISYNLFIADIHHMHNNKIIKHIMKIINKDDLRYFPLLQIPLCKIQCFSENECGKSVYKSNKLFSKNYYNEHGNCYLMVHYYENGIIKNKRLLNENGKLHCITGPALICYNAKGKMSSRYYYLNGNHLLNVKSNKQLLKYIKLQNIS